MKYSLMVDVDKCIGCHTCEVACKQENSQPAGPKWIRVVKVGPRIVEGKLRMDFVPIMCEHCVQPPCLDSCPQEAITQRSDGIVLVNEELCNGCRQCDSKCPFGAIRFDEKGVASKCTLCVHRLDAGLEPSCVHHCPAKALIFGDSDEIPVIVRKRSAGRHLLLQ